MRDRLGQLLARFSNRYRLAAVLFVACLTLSVVPFMPAGHSGAPGRSVTIPAHADALQVASALRAKHVIRNRWAFAALVRLTGSTDKIQPGSYSLSPGQNSFEILRWLIEGLGRQQKMVVPEGYSAVRIAHLLDVRGLASGSVFLSLAHQPAHFYPHHPWLKTLAPHQSLEGFLFPATYLFDGDRVSEEGLIDQMLTRFKSVILKRYQQAEGSPLPFLQALTMASIIELEAVKPEERPLISGVFYNRLRTGMRLGSDPTVEYALGWHQGAKGLSLRDVRVDSPYNTYRYSGLPPGPIGNPGLASFEAALRPATTSFLYFVAKGDGTHAFTLSYQEHLAVQRRIRHE